MVCPIIRIQAIARLTPLIYSVFFQNVLSVTAQIIPDRTLGNESTIVTPDLINGIESDRIDGGAIRNSNLFHSFEEFNINQGRGAYFTNPSGIETIFTRVTGQNSSNLFGTLGVLGNANLFLLNPNGILFGPNARLDLGGSFIGSTATSILFNNGMDFSATDPQAVPLLTINVPIGLNFDENSGDIINQSVATNLAGDIVGLEVAEGETLGLFGNRIELPGGNLTAPGGHIELGSIATAGTIGILSGNNTPRFSFPDDPSIIAGDIVLNQATLSVIHDNLGSISVNAANIDILDSSQFNAGIQTLSGSANAQAGTITLNATDTINISHNSVVANQVGFEAVGDGGDINIRAGSLVLSDGGQISTLTLGTGNAGKVSVQGDRIRLTGNNTGIFSNVDRVDNLTSVSVGNSGGIEIDTNQITLEEGAQLQSITFGQGNAGAIDIAAQDSVNLSGANTSIFSAMVSDFSTQSDGIVITANSLSMSDGAQVISKSIGTGMSGEISIMTQGPILLRSSNTGILSQNLSSVPSGGINIQGLSLTMSNGSSVNSQGSFASVLVNAQEDISLSDTDTHIVTSLTSGTGGIDLQGRSVSLADGAQIIGQHFLGSDGGLVSIQGRDEISLAGANTGIISNFVNQQVGMNVINDAIARGNALDISLSGGSISMRDGAQIQSLTEGRGNGGSIVLKGNDLISLTGANTAIFNVVTEAGMGANSGDISIESHRFSLTEGAQLVSATFGRGNAGKVSVNAIDDITLSGANTVIFSSVGSGADSERTIFPELAQTSPDATAIGNSGGIELRGRSLTLTDGAQITASTFDFQQGNAGNILIDITETIALEGNSQLRNPTPSELTNQTSIFVNENSPTDPTIIVDLLSPQAPDIDETVVDVENGDASLDLTPTPTGGDPIPTVIPQVLGSSGEGASTGIFSTVETQARGNAGNITLRSRFFSLKNGAQVQTVTRGFGNAGSIRVEAEDRVTVMGRSPDGNVSSGLFSSAEATAMGQGGDVEIMTSELHLSDGAGINARGVGENAAGSIDVDATGDVTLSDRAVLSAETTSGTQGNITLRSDRLFVRNNSRITTDATGTATGGNIAIDTTFLVARNNGDINANAEQSNGGQVIINARGIFGTEFREGILNTPDSDITASSRLGLQFSGTVQLNTPDVDPTSGLIDFPETLIDPSALIAQNVCVQSVKSELIITGRGGLPPSPNESSNPDLVNVDLVEPAPIESVQVMPSQTAEAIDPTGSNKLIPARGWIFNQNGEVVLTADYQENNLQNLEGDSEGDSERSPWSNFVCE